MPNTVAAAAGTKTATGTVHSKPAQPRPTAHRPFSEPLTKVSRGTFETDDAVLAIALCDIVSLIRGAA